MRFLSFKRYYIISIPIDDGSQITWGQHVRLAATLPHKCTTSADIDLYAIMDRELSSQ